jgi:hypothetical protein
MFIRFMGSVSVGGLATGRHAARRMGDVESAISASDQSAIDASAVEIQHCGQAQAVFAQAVKDAG